MQTIRTHLRATAMLVLLFGAAAASFATEAPTSIVVGEEHKVFSRALNEERSVLISKPVGYDRGNERYPVLVVLDGRSHFEHTSALVNYLGRENALPDMLVVAIDNPPRLRARDLTPAATDPATRAQAPTGGGAAAFRSFIADELMGWIDQNYRTLPYKVLAGHSYGGLFVVDTLLVRPELFNAYVAISPSLWWDNERLIEDASAFLKARHDLNTTLYLSIASDEARELRGSVTKFAGVLESYAPAGFQWRLDDLQREVHDSSVPRATRQGLDFLFSDAFMPNGMDLFNLGGIDAVIRFYERRNEKYGYESSDVSEIAVQSVARQLMDAERLDELTALLVRYQNNFQPPARIYVQIADAYRRQGHNDRAIELYRLALKADPSQAPAQEALSELGVN